MERKNIKALGLCSGGLDSILSGMILKNQGIDVTWVSFETPFFSSDKAEKASRQTGIPLVRKDITDVYLGMLKNPKLGYGKNMNPCRDCHALMFNLAGEMMQKEGYSFLFSGEVLGQRPLSQTKQALRYVEKQSGFDGSILRPLSARALPETDMEKRGMVDREFLKDFSGRSRKPQIELAKEMGITKYPAPAGGCLLTDKNFSRRLMDLFDHEENHRVNDIHLLKYGRHIRLSGNVKIVVGRTKGDNHSILSLNHDGRYMELDVMGIGSPATLVPVTADAELVRLAASICVGYTKTPKDQEAKVRITLKDGVETVTVIGVEPGSAGALI
jgi:tRNA U34 2-thiouridine synthase MnmA/TrmU